MQSRLPLTDQYLHILQKIEPLINRKDFCKLHRISQAKLSRILSGKTQVDFELLDYLCMSAGFEIKLTINKNNL